MKEVILTDEGLHRKNTFSGEVAQALVALDLSKTDESVLEYFDFWASAVQVKKVCGVHVVPSFDFFRNVPVQVAMGIEGAVTINEEIVKKMKREFFDYFENENLSDLHYRILEGDPLHEILNLAEEVGADLMVVGKKEGNTGLGVLAKNLVRKFNGNTLVVPIDAVEKMERILVPVDFSEGSGRALAAALQVAARQENDVVVEVMYVFDSPDLSVYKVNMTREDYRGMLVSYVEEAMNTFLDKWAGAEAPEIQSRILEKTMPGVSRFIYQEALGTKADFIVMGAKGHSKVERLLIGSVTEKLLHINDAIPVMIIK